MSMNNKFIEFLWVSIWRSPDSLDLSQDAASCAIWMFTSLTLRTLLSLLGILRFIPEGFIFSFPFLLQYIAQKCGIVFMSTHYPLLPVRVAEVFMGRIRRHRFPYVIIAHLLGCLFGLTMYMTLFGWVSEYTGTPQQEVLLPIRSSFYGDNDIFAYPSSSSSFSSSLNSTICAYADSAGVEGTENGTSSLPHSLSLSQSEHILTFSANVSKFYDNISRVGTGWIIYHVFTDTMISFLFCIMIITLPELLHLNKRNIYFMSGALACVLLLHALLLSGDSLSTGVNPSAGATLWYLHTPYLNTMTHTGSGSSARVGTCGNSFSMSSNSVIGVDIDIDVDATQLHGHHKSSLPTASETTTITATDDTVLINTDTATVYPLLPNIHNLSIVRGIIHIFMSICFLVKYYIFTSTLFLEQWIGCMMGGAMAGIFCGKYTPDDSSAWKRKVI